MQKSLELSQDSKTVWAEISVLGGLWWFWRCHKGVAEVWCGVWDGPGFVFVPAVQSL